jgi:nucleotide-binding universal stress UspA family protein
MAEGPFTRILVATMGRPWSERALELAVRMAKASHLELVVVAVLTPDYVPKKRATWGVAHSLEVEEDVRQLVERVLQKASAFAKAQGVTPICELRRGRPAEEILKAVEEHQCDVILIGSRGLSGVSRVTLGETGNEVVLKAPVPVIVVK